MEASSSSEFSRIDDPSVAVPLPGGINGGKDRQVPVIGDQEVDYFKTILDIDDPFLAYRKECTICLESLQNSAFPQENPTCECQHDIEVCIECLRYHISSTMAQRGWDRIECPTCFQRLEYLDVKASAASCTFEK